MGKNFEKPITDIIQLIKENSDPIEAVKNYFESEVTNIDLQKVILRKLAEKPEFKGKEEELKKLRPRDANSFAEDEGFEKYLQNYDPEKGYRCSVFATSTGKYGKLVFDRGTLNFIGARTSRGKTTAMVSMAVDALLQDRQVFFSTFEETGYQIITRIVLNFAYREIMNNFDLQDEIEKTSFSPGKIFQSIIRSGEPEYNPFDKKNKENNDSKKAAEYLKSLENILKETYYNKVKPLLRSNRLTIYNGYLNDLTSYLDELANIERGTVVFADYIQKIPTPAAINSTNRYANIKQLLRDIDTVVKKNDIISINGAQFGRTDNKTNPNIKDSFTDESFQESSDIEQIGEIEIGIGRDPMNADEGRTKKGKKTESENTGTAGNNKGKTKARMFFTVLKNRNGANDPTKEFDLVDGRKFSYYATDLNNKEED